MQKINFFTKEKQQTKDQFSHKHKATNKRPIFAPTSSNKQKTNFRTNIKQQTKDQLSHQHKATNKRPIFSPT
jgi:hypothetical protein